ncbi:hypothetical protein [Bernardetia sp.]|uniref:hypothetical protein n=1 Tax=Bernardetia sp. TaxID=1937974 RepID=UPI0025C4D187|nr:hypothetical protein [Bernardetia sp.]
MQTKKPILFTGAFYSEQEWIEPILSVFPFVHYLPYFFSSHTETTEVFSFEHKFPCMHPQEDNPYASFIKEFFSDKTEETSKNAFGSGFKQFYQRIREKYQVNKEIKREIRPLIYDKYGVFLAEWLHRHYKTDVVILIQHPLSFVFEWIEKKESTDFDKLFSDKVAKYAPNAFARVQLEQQENIFSSLQEWEKAMRIWLVFAETILYYQQNYPDWLFFRYEDFRETPDRTLIDICDMLDLGYTPNFLNKIEETNTVREKDAKKVTADYTRKLLDETQEYLTHFYPRTNIGKSMFR